MDVIPLVVALVIGIIPIGLFVYSLWHFGIFIYHWHKVVTNVTNKYAMFMGPFLLLNKNNFNEIGQIHFEKMKKPFKIFILAIIPVLIFMAALSLIPQNGI